MTTHPASGGAASGFSLGTVIAACLSWSFHHSVGLAILHGLLSWLYVIAWLT